MTDIDKLAREYVIIPIYGGKSAIIDKCDEQEINNHKWHLSFTSKDKTRFYAATHINNKTIRMHRIIVKAEKDQVVDHKNGNTLDNRRNNLRITNKNGNMWNMKKKKSGSSSKYKGVYLHKASGMWEASITYNGKRIRQLRYKKEEDAANAYNILAKKYFGEFARLNPLPLPSEKVKP